MTPGPLDHLLAVVFALVFPIVAYVQYERRRAGLRADAPGLRVREYQDTIAWLGGMGVATVAVWLAAGRPWAALGLGTLEWRTPEIVVTAGLVLVAVFFGWQLHLLRTDARARELLREQASDVDEFLSRTAREDRWFRGVAVSAGVGEELFYRGFLFWYLSAVLPPIAAGVGSAVFFAVAHAMHGRSATLRAGTLGLVFSGIYAWTGTLYGPIVLHTLVDWFAGRAAVVARDRLT